MKAVYKKVRSVYDENALSKSATGLWFTRLPFENLNAKDAPRFPCRVVDKIDEIFQTQLR